MTITELLNHSRLCTLEEVRKRLERLQRTQPKEYEVIENFLLSCKPKNKLAPGEQVLTDS